METIIKTTTTVNLSALSPCQSCSYSGRVYRSSKSGETTIAGRRVELFVSAGVTQTRNVGALSPVSDQEPLRLLNRRDPGLQELALPWNRSKNTLVSLRPCLQV